jgi:outer membrane protein TolC
MTSRLLSSSRPWWGAGILSPIALLLFLPGWATGQEADPLTLEEAFRRALASNPAYIQTSNDLELNRIDRRDAWLSILPQPSITFLNTSMNWQRQTVLEDLDGTPLPNPETAMVQTSRSNQGATLGFTVNFQNFLNLREQETQAELRRTNVVREYQELEADVTQAFFEVQERAVTVELEEELLETDLQNKEAAERLYRLARRDRIDLVQAELDLAEQESALEEARFEYENAFLSLRNLIGDPDLGTFRIAEVPVRVFDPSVLDEEELVSFALAQAPPVLQQEASIESARRQLTQGRAEWLPTLSVSLNTSRQEFVRDSGGAFLQPLPDAGWDRNVGFQLNFPDLGQYFNRQNNQRSRAISVENAQEQLRQVRMELDQNIRTLLVNLRSAYRSVELQDRRVALAQEQLELQFESYRLGRVDFLQLQGATESAAQARRQALQARYSFESARISLERALGVPLEVPEGAFMETTDLPGGN